MSQRVCVGVSVWCGDALSWVSGPGARLRAWRESGVYHSWVPCLADWPAASHRSAGAPLHSPPPTTTAQDYWRTALYILDRQGKKHMDNTQHFLWKIICKIISYFSVLQHRGALLFAVRLYIVSDNKANEKKSLHVGVQWISQVKTDMCY